MNHGKSEGNQKMDQGMTATAIGRSAGSTRRPRSVTRAKVGVVVAALGGLAGLGATFTIHAIQGVAPGGVPRTITLPEILHKLSAAWLKGEPLPDA